MSNVVVIDDSVVVRKIVEIILGRCGITCMSYQDGYEALKAFKTGEDYIPDLIFLDIGLPKIDGYDLLRLMKTSPQFDHTSVVMLSGRDGVLDRLKSRLAGAKGYVTKPFKTQELLSIALSCLERPSNASFRPAATNRRVSIHRHLDEGSPGNTKPV
jgi:DNA-binding response OmpR family regulator